MDAGAALEQISEGLDALRAAGFDHDDVAGAAELIRAVEAAGRKMDAARLDLLSAIDASRVYGSDGHRSAKVMVRHVAQLSPAAAVRWAQSVAMGTTLPRIAAAHAAGEIGTCQVARLGRLHANRRVRPHMADAEDTFLAWAMELSYKEFDLVLSRWECLADADGAADRHRRGHEKRDVRLDPDFDGNWILSGQFGSLQGARFNDILEHFIQAEWESDWAEARARLGDAATTDDLARSDAQRRADALLALAEQGATAIPGEGGASFVTDIVIDHHTFQRELAALADITLPPRDPADPKYRSETLDGHPLDPAQVVWAALVDEVRRVVVGADGVVIDMGRRRRFIRGAALAARLSNNECMWPGCHVPATNCQIDHLHPYAQGGDTDTDNAAPACGAHNRHKHTHRWRTWRDPDGRWHLQRPDGTTVQGPRPPSRPTSDSPSRGSPSRGSPPRGSPSRGSPDAEAARGDTPDPDDPDIDEPTRHGGLAAG